MRSNLFRVAVAAFLLCILAPISQAQSVHENGDNMSVVLSAVEAEDWVRAAHMAQQIPDPMAAVLVEWFRLRAGEGDWREYTAFLSRNPDWPGLRRLRSMGEANMPDTLRSATVRAYFEDQPPQRGRGVLRLASAYQTIGRTADARAEAIRAWTSFSLAKSEEDALLRDYSGILSRHHEARLDMLLWRGLTREAQRMLPRVNAGQRALAEARIALRRTAAGVDALIEKVPEALSKHPGLTYERFNWRVKKDRWDEAEEMLLGLARAKADLGRPASWAPRRRGFARRALRRGEANNAYLMASRHGLDADGGYDYADLEWLSGYIALRHFRKPDLAVEHFSRFRDAVSTPISLGRAGYWLGRAQDAANEPEKAREAYQLGATYQTSFYGQLAAQRGELPTDASLIGHQAEGTWQGADFLGSSVFRAGLLLHYADEQRYVRWFFTHMAETMSQSDQAKLAQLALEIERPHVALRIAKEAAKQGRVISAPYYPVTELAYFGVDVPAELAMAIARQESELNPQASSPAGARGLMQIMPATARGVAQELGVEYSKSRLANDWRYNARLGIAYLSGLIEQYRGSVLLAAAAYNAGPTRVNSWIEEYGDPRRRDIDEIDWIENIPFRETRNYVQRILESLHVYRLRINGRVEPLRLAQDLSLDQ